MKYHGYEIDPKFVMDDGGDEVISWQTAGLGEFVFGTKGGKRWFIKRNNEYRFITLADVGGDKELYDEAMNGPRRYQAEREELHRLMVEKGGLTADKDHIVAEDEIFVADGRIVLVSRFVENIARDVNFTKMEPAAFIRFCADTAELLRKLHASGVIHCDLKVGNVEDVMSGNIVAAVGGGKLTPYLIDFDLSFPGPPAKNPEGIPHSDNYESPEIIPYIDGEEDKFEEITSATDIFTLAVVFHRLWTGNFPETGDKKVSAGRCVSESKELKVDKKFDIKLGDSCGATFMSLLSWMMAKDPKVRPTAEQVMAVLEDKIPVPDAFHTGSDVKIYADLWPMHARNAERISVEEFKAAGVVSFKNVADGGIKKYLVRFKDDTETYMTFEELIDAGYAKRRPAEVSDTWPEHNIVMETPDKIAEKGYMKVMRAEVGGHRYVIVTASGVAFSHGYEWLLSEGLATKKPVEAIGGDEPWPGDGKYASPEYMAERGVKNITRVVYGGENRYKVEFIDRAPLEHVSANTMKKLRYLI